MNNIILNFNTHINIIIQIVQIYYNNHIGSFNYYSKKIKIYKLTKTLYKTLGIIFLKD